MSCVFWVQLDVSLTGLRLTMRSPLCGNPSPLPRHCSEHHCCTNIRPAENTHCMTSRKSEHLLVGVGPKLQTNEYFACLGKCSPRSFRSRQGLTCTRSSAVEDRSDPGPSQSRPTLHQMLSVISAAHSTTTAAQPAAVAASVPGRRGLRPAARSRPGRHSLPGDVPPATRAATYVATCKVGKHTRERVIC